MGSNPVGDSELFLCPRQVTNKPFFFYQVVVCILLALHSLHDICNVFIKLPVEVF